MSGIERKIDKLGRIVLPIGYRKRLGLSENSKVAVSIQDNTICISPSERKCLICNSKSNVNQGFKICSECIKRIKNS